MEEEIRMHHLFFLWMLYYYVEKNEDPGYMKEKNEGTYSTVVWWVLGSCLYFRNVYVFYKQWPDTKLKKEWQGLKATILPHLKYTI